MGWRWWHRKYAPGDTVLVFLPKAVRPFKIVDVSEDSSPEKARNVKVSFSFSPRIKESRNRELTTKMNQTFTLWLATIFLVLGVSALGAEHPELKIFPSAKEGMDRFVMMLSHKGRGEEDDFMVEIIVGKTMLTDGINQMWLDNALEPRLLEGWGYPYYEVTGSPSVMSTMMAVPEGTTPVKRFVSASPLQVRYNSRLPIVVYAPEGYEVRYRIWKASDTTETAEKG